MSSTKLKIFESTDPRVVESLFDDWTASRDDVIIEFVVFNFLNNMMVMAVLYFIAEEGDEWD